MAILLNAVSSGIGPEVEPPASYQALHGDSVYHVYVATTDIGAASVTIQVSPDGTNWFTARRTDENQATFTVADVHTLRVRAKLMRASISGTATAPITAWVL